MGATLIGIAKTRELRAPMEEVDTADISVEQGLASDARGRKPGRQVTVLFREGWEAACGEVDTKLPWTTRRANLYVAGLEFPREIGWRLRIGDVVLEVTEETAPCQLMERAHVGLRKAMTPDWRGGVCCNVVAGGSIKIGDPVSVSAV
jgi:MOSC domain-containing protein YiiM